MIDKTKLLAIVILLILSNFIHCNVKQNNSAQKQLFDLNWKFDTGNNIHASEVDFNDQNWRCLDLPHNWNEDSELSEWESNISSNSFQFETGWYRKDFKIPRNWMNKTILIDFEGMSENTEIFINGTSIVDSTERNTFQKKLNPYLNFDGDNVIAIRINASNQKNTKITKTGIYKHVWLVIKDSASADF